MLLLATEWYEGVSAWYEMPNSISSKRSTPPRGNVTATVLIYHHCYDSSSLPLFVIITHVLWTSHSPQCAGRTQPGQTEISLWGWGFHAVRGVIDPKDHRFRSRVVVVVHV